MTNYTEKLANVTNLEELKAVIENINEDIQDNAEFILDINRMNKQVKILNNQYRNEFSARFNRSLLADRKTAFIELVKVPNYDRIVITENENGTYKIEVKSALFRFTDLEDYIQSFNQPRDVNGRVIKDKNKTVFGALRFYGLCDCFIRNLFSNNLTIDNEKVVNLAKVKIADKTIFDENDGKCFASTSNNALEKQLNVLAKFFELDVKMLKKDLPILKMSAQKIKRDADTNKSSINEVKTLKFADVLFSVITSRYNNEDVKVYTNDGEEVKAEAKAEAETVAGAEVKTEA